MTLFVFYHGKFTLVREHGLFTRMDFRAHHFVFQSDRACRLSAVRVCIDHHERSCAENSGWISIHCIGFLYLSTVSFLFVASLAKVITFTFSPFLISQFSLLSPRARLHVMGILRFMSKTRTGRACSLLFVLFLCLFLSLSPFQLYFIPLLLPTTLRFLTLFFRSYFCLIGLFNCLSL